MEGSLYDAVDKFLEEPIMLKRIYAFLGLSITLFYALGAEECCECDWPRDFRFSYCCDAECWQPAAGFGPVDVAPGYSVDMLSRLHYRPVKQLVLLQYARCMPCQQVLLSAQLRASACYGHTNKKDKFGYMGRFPINFRGHEASEADINDFTLSLTYSPLRWVHGYWEFLHSDYVAFSHDPRQGYNHTQKVYAVVGDFDRSPFYFTIGRRDVAFGAMYTVNPFTPSVTWHYFGPLAEGASVGYYDGPLHIEAMAINGGRGIRVADTNETGRIDNWSLNASYGFCIGGWSIRAGAGYLYSTIYDGAVAEHEGPISKGPRNGIWDVNLEIVHDQWRSYCEYCTTEHRWRATRHRVHTFSWGTSYCMRDPWCNVVVLSAEYGEGIQGPECSEYFWNSQVTLGLNYIFKYNAQFSFEYVRCHGFAPLLNITKPGVSNRDALENVFLLGLTLNI